MGLRRNVAAVGQAPLCWDRCFQSRTQWEFEAFLNQALPAFYLLKSSLVTDLLLQLSATACTVSAHHHLTSHTRGCCCLFGNTSFTPKLLFWSQEGFCNQCQIWPCIEERGGKKKPRPKNRSFSSTAAKASRWERASPSLRAGSCQGQQGWSMSRADAGTALHWGQTTCCSLNFICGHPDA